MCFMFARGHSPAPRSLETDELERAGADFMLHCFRRQMNGTYSRSSTWSLPSQIPDLADTEAKFQEEMEKFLQRNASNRLLLHIDEHRSMSTSPEFRRGALLLAGSLPQMCQVIATYLEPPDLAAQGSSQVCRFPIAMMLVDVSPLLTGTLQMLHLPRQQDCRKSNFLPKAGVARKNDCSQLCESS